MNPGHDIPLLNAVAAVIDRGCVETTAHVTPEIRTGAVFLTFHFVDPLANALTGDALDPVAKIPEYKHSAVRVRGRD